jgi:ketosteroid isomerase-like protein
MTEVCSALYPVGDPADGDRIGYPILNSALGGAPIADHCLHRTGLFWGIMRSMADDSVRIVQAFNDATNRHDIDAMLALVSDDILFESTAPPDGERLVGKSSVRQVWEGIFRESPNARVETEDLIVCADRCIALVCYVFDHENPDAGHVRAVDVLRVEHGKISEKLSYVKG